jgi:hypothetical protein
LLIFEELMIMPFILGCENFILGFGCGIWKGGKNGPLLWAHEPNPLRWLVQTDLWADKVVLRSLLFALLHAWCETKPPPPEESRNHPMRKSHMWAYDFESFVKRLGPQGEDRGLFVALEFFGVILMMHPAIPLFE